MGNPYLVNGTTSPQSIFDTPTTTPAHRIGTRGIMDDGRVFYYCRNGQAVALAIGELYARQAVVANHVNNAVAASVNPAGTNIISSITIGATLMSLNQYADGYLNINAGTGAGSLFRIKEHAAFASAATTVAVTLYDRIPTALDATSKVTFVFNQFDTPQASPTAQTDSLVGVPPIAFPVASAAAPVFGWIQTWGEAAVRADTATVAAQGGFVVTGITTAGRTQRDATATTLTQMPGVGWAVHAQTASEYRTVNLTIRP